MRSGRLFDVALTLAATASSCRLSAAILFRQPPPRRRIRLRPAQPAFLPRSPAARFSRQRLAIERDELIGEDHRSRLDPHVVRRRPREAQADSHVGWTSSRSDAGPPWATAGFKMGGPARFASLSHPTPLQRGTFSNGSSTMVFCICCRRSRLRCGFRGGRFARRRFLLLGRLKGEPAFGFNVVVFLEPLHEIELRVQAAGRTIEVLPVDALRKHVAQVPSATRGSHDLNSL